MSLRDLEFSPRSTTIKRLSRIAEKVSNSANPDIVRCLYCNRDVKPSRYENHRCAGKRYRDLYGRDKALAIMEAQKKDWKIRQSRKIPSPVMDEVTAHEVRGY